MSLVELTSNFNRKMRRPMSYYRNGYGEPIYNPSAYYAAVAEDRYGYNSYRCWNCGSRYYW